MTPNLAQPSDLTPAQAEAEPYTPTIKEVRIRYAEYVTEPGGIHERVIARNAEFDRFMAEHDRAKDAEIAAQKLGLDAALNVLRNVDQTELVQELTHILMTALTSSQPTTEKAPFTPAKARELLGMGDDEPNNATGWLTRETFKQMTATPKETPDHE